MATGEVLTIEAILERYSAVVTPDTGDDLAGVLLSDPQDMPVGSISPRIGGAPAEHAILTVPDDNYLDDETSGGSDTVASQVTAPEPRLEGAAEEADDVPTTGPTAKLIPSLATAASIQDDDAANE